MGTRAAAFTAKIHNLQHYSGRIKHNLLPLPSGDDVANTLKYFSQTLLSVLRDVPSISFDVLRSPEKDAFRTALFPSLDYKTLLHALVGLVEAVPLVQHGAHALGYTILHTLACLVPFLEHELMDTLPYLVASTMTTFPCSLHKDIIDVLCNHLLPFTFRADFKGNSESYASMSTAAILMIIFQYTDCNAYHCQVLECLMSLKKDIVKDLFCVIAHGIPKARCHAVELLFQYLPTLNPELLDRKGIGWLLDSLCTLTSLVLFPTFSPSSVSPSLMPQGAGNAGWKARVCQTEGCVGNDAIKMCFEHSVAITSGEHAPPFYLCEECAKKVESEHGSEHLVDVLLPMDKVSVICEDPSCKATEKSAVAICFSIECAKQNNHRPMKYCAQCILIHETHFNDDHMLHTTIPSPWNMDLETQSYLVEAIVSLLCEAEPLSEKHMQDSINGQDERDENSDNSLIRDKQLLSRYGIWLLVDLCTPNENTPNESLGRLLSILFQWFHYTACLPDGQAGNALEHLKGEYIHGWLMKVLKTHFDVFVSCLLPHPVDYAKVGGPWELWPCYPVQVKEGLKRLLCLAPYDVLTVEVWKHIMPYWMDAFRHEALKDEFAELKILLSSVLDPTLSPLAFNEKQMFNFLIERFEVPFAPVQEQALYWLQTLSMLEVPVPLELLYDMFMNGVKNLNSTRDLNSDVLTSLLIPPPSLSYKESQHFQRTHTGLINVQEEENLLDPEYKSDGEIHLSCYILMLDIFIKQFELHEINMHKGLEQKDAQNILLLIKKLVEAPWDGSHTCEETTEGSQCVFCETCAIFYQLSFMLIEYFSPVMEVTMADIPVISYQSEDMDTLYQTENSPEKIKQDGKVESEEPLIPHLKVEGVLQQSAMNLSEKTEDNVFVVNPSIHTAVQECTAELDTVAVIPEETVLIAMAKEVTLTDDDVAGATCTVSSPLLLDENQEAIPQSTDDSTFWHTTEGKYKFTIEELPPQLQLFYVLLKDLAVHEDADILYNNLACLKIMCLHAEVLNKAANNHRGFIIWCQENLLIVNLWKLLQMEFSNIAQLATSLLFHALTLPGGFDVFWKILETEFHSNKWQDRFAAVEKTTVIVHFIESLSVKNSPLMQSALAGSFCYLVHSLDDEESSVSQRTLLNLDSIKTPSLKLCVWCLEVQFNNNVSDRPLILQTVFQIHNQLTNKRFLSWDFFLNCFDTLFLEDQIILERLGDISYVRDLKNTNVNSEMFQKKLKRAHEALAHLSSTRSLTASFGDKMTYNRSMSTPSAKQLRHDKIDKEKYYERQSPAPVLKRKSSRLLGSTFGTPLQHIPNSFFTDGHLKDMVQEETHFLNVLFRAMDVEDHDKETLPLVIFLLMQFLSRPDPIHRTDDKITRSQHIVLRHLNILLGYSHNQGEGRFLLPPHKVRSSSIFSTFLMCMPKILDYNFEMGTYLLTTFLSILVCCPSPGKYPSELYPPTYSLWMLDSFCRHSWLQSVLVIMYKYHYENYPYSRYVQWVVLIILNTLKCQHHRCKQIHEPLLSPLPSRSRDYSTHSADIQHLLEKEKDSVYESTYLDESSKFFKGKKFSSTEKSEEQIFDIKQSEKDKNHQWTSWKSSERSYSSEGEDADQELEAIPESPKSESFELEQLTSDLCTEPVEQACANVVNEPYSVEDNVDETNQSVKISEVTTYKLDSAKIISGHNFGAQSSLSLENENINNVEKSLLESMEKNILQVFPIPTIEVKEQNSEMKDINKISFPSQVPPKSPGTMANLEWGNIEMCKFKSETATKAGVPTFYIKSDKKPPSDKNLAVKYSKKPHHKEDLSRMRSLPFPDNHHQSVCRSKTDSNILKLPQNNDLKMSHSRFPHPMSTLSKSKQSTKSSHKLDMLTSKSFSTFRPPLERLLPIGIPEKDKSRRNDALSNISFNEPDDETSPKGTSVEGDLFEDKGVQTSNADFQIEIPAPERLLPVGPLPTKMDCYAIASKADLGVFHSDSLTRNINPHIMQKNNLDVDKTASDQNNLGLSQADKSKIELPILDLTPVKIKSTEISEVKVLPQFAEVNTKVVQQPESSAIGALAGANFINKLFDIAPENGVTGSVFGVFDMVKNNMDFRNEDKHPKDVENESLRNSTGSIEFVSNNKSDGMNFAQENTTQKSLEKSFEEEVKGRFPYRQRKQRKSGLSTLEAQRSCDDQNVCGRRFRKVEVGGISSVGKRSSAFQSFYPRGLDDMIIERCTECGSVIEEYSDEEIGLCIVILSTFIHRESAMAAPLLPKILRIVARIAASSKYPWQSESTILLPAGSVSVARHFLRCTLHKLASNGVFMQIFQSHIIEPEFYKTMASALADFNELNQVTPLIMLFENLNEQKHLNHEVVFHVLDNVAIYLDCLPLESTNLPWVSFLQQLDLFLRKILLALSPEPIQLDSVLQIILCALKLPVIREAKSILDPFSKILSHAIQHSFLDYHLLSELCTVCHSNARERDKLLLTKTAIFELFQALKFKTCVPDANLLTLVQFVLADCGGRLAPNIILDDATISYETQSLYKTLSGECIQTYLNDTLEFVSDVHTLSKVKTVLYGNSTHLNEETLGGHLKAGLSQYLAVEFSKNNGRDNRAISRYIPWLYHPPTIIQQGPKEYTDCVSHIRLLSWLLLGALTHSAVMQTPTPCQPIPLEANSHIAEHIQVILAGFSEQSKVSVLHMSSLFHAFILCQLWTMYCEHMVALNPPGSDQNQMCCLTLTDFWVKVTPGILQLVCHSKEEYPQLAEMVSLHFLSLMEALQECNSTILARLLPMWIPVLYSFQDHLSDNLQIRLQACVSCCPPTRSKEDTTSSSTTFLRWLQRLQFKIGQIEMQSSTATQFYSL